MTDRIAAPLLLGLCLITLLAGCAGRAWNAARSQDTVAAYHDFLEAHPDSDWSPEARARLTMVRIRKNPTREAYQRFLEEHPDPALRAELAPFVEETFFRHARSRGDAQAFEDFLVDFPDGAFARRARGNAVYLASNGFGGDVEALSRFAGEYPESDFAAEAQRSAAAVARRGQSAIRRVGVVIEVSARTPGRDRVARAFLERAGVAYQRAGLQLVPLPDASRANEAGVQALLRIRHDEREMGSELAAGRVVEPAIVATTEVTLQPSHASELLWSDSFEYRSPLTARRDESASILFGPGAQSGYWSDLQGKFFVPVASWDNRVTAREPQPFARPVVALEVSGSRAAVLFGDGDFELFDLGDPARPVRLGVYDRERDLSSFSGARLHGSQVAIFGADGLEIVRLEGDATRRERDFGRDAVGSPVDALAIGDVWLAAGNRGLLELGATGDAVRTLLPRPIPGMDSLGDRVVFTDGVSLYVSTLELLRAGRVESEFRLGRGFAPGRVRVHGTTAVVLGARDSVWIDLGRPAAPRLLSRIGGNESGRVSDAAVIGGRLFLLGPRGLQVADPSGEHIVDSIDVHTRERVDVSGRHLVMIGEKMLQVVDATPYLASAAARQEPRP